MSCMKKILNARVSRVRRGMELIWRLDCVEGECLWRVKKNKENEWLEFKKCGEEVKEKIVTQGLGREWYCGKLGAKT